MTLSTREQQEVDEANAADRQPVVFVHGLWLLPSSWEKWRKLFEDNGYATLAPDWPGDQATVEAARANPETFAGKTVRQVTDHFAEVIGKLDTKPVVIGHSFGGLITQQLAGRGLAAVSVPIDPAPFRGVLPLPLSALKASFPVLSNALNYNRSVLLTAKQFRFAFGNAVSETESAELYETYSVPGSGRPLFSAATANLNPSSQAKVDTRNPNRGPMLLVSGQRDNTVPWAIANASFKRQGRNSAVTEITEMPGRGHSLVIDSGWREVADIALVFMQQHVPKTA
jgi:pimeloyl-ACP methyl ester carboxylesterase